MAGGVELATAYITVLPDGSKIAPELRKQFGKADGDAERAGKSSGRKFSGGFSGGLKLLGGAAIGSAAVSFLKGGIESATSFQDEMGALNVIIGKRGTEAVEKFADSSAKAFGISKVDALEAAHTFSTFGKSAGLSGVELANFSTEFAGLAGDLASFNGGSTDDAIQAIGAALRGEAEPIRRYGVLLDDATLRNEALRLGLIKTTKTALTPQQKVLAAQAAIYKQTKDAQGDSARTADSAANSQKRLTAQLKDLRLEAGTKLLPVATKVVAKTSELVDGFQAGTGAGGDIRDVLEDVVDVGKGVLDFFNSIPGPVKKFAVQGLLAYAALRKIQSITGPVVNGFSRMTTGIQTTTTGFRNAETRLATTAKLSQQVGGAMRQAAGVGGALLLANGLSKVETSAGKAQVVLGSAAAGFATGGPIGAAVGSLAGGIGLLARDLTRTHDNVKVGIGDWSQYSETLDGVTAAVTGTSKAFIFQQLQQAGVLNKTKALGISDRQVINGIANGGKARARLVSQLQKQRDALDANEKAYADEIISSEGANASSYAKVAAYAAENDARRANIQAVFDAIGASEKEIAEKKRGILATQKLTTVYKGLPKQAITEIRQKGGDLTRSQIVDLTRKYDNIDDRDVKTLLSVNNLPNTVADIRKVKAEADKAAVPRTLNFKVNAQGYIQGGLLTTLLGREHGGPVSAGQPYIVGERRPELFIPNQSGRIVPKVPASSTATAGPISLAGQRVTLSLFGRQVEGIFEEVADARIDSAAAMQGEMDRAL